MAPQAEAKAAPVDGLNIIEKKQLKHAQKTTLPAAKAIQNEQKSVAPKATTH